MTGHSVRRKRVGTYLSVLILLAAQFLCFGHLVLVRHVVCLQHGHLMHAPDSTAVRHGRVDRDPRPYGAVAGTPPGGPWEHDHCLLCATAAERYIMSSPACHDIGGLPAEVALRPTADAVACVPIAPLVVSPKNSPPAV